MPATCELLETLGIPVLGYRTDELPLFYAARGGPPVSARVEDASEAAAIAIAHWGLGRTTAVVLARPPDESLDDAEPLIEEALALAEERGVRGQDVTPFVLDHLHRGERWPDAARESRARRRQRGARRRGRRRARGIGARLGRTTAVPDAPGILL